jgi:DNA-binding MarR family transcriptional regulator
VSSDDIGKRERLANELVLVLPSFGRWVSSIRNSDTPFGRMAFRQVEILYIIRKNLLRSNIVTPSDLAEFLSVRRSVVTRVLANLEERGFVVRHTTPGDRRSQALEITAKGTAVSEYIEDIFHREMIDALDFLDDERVTTMLGELPELRQLSATLEQLRKQRDPLGGESSEL